MTRRGPHARKFPPALILRLAVCCAGLVVAFGAKPSMASFSSGGVKQSEEYRPPEIKLRWIDPWGKVFELPWKTATRWEWIDHPMKLPVKVPALRSWFEIPESWEVALFQSSNMVRVTDVPSPPFSAGKGLVVAFDTQALVARGTLILKDPEGKLHEYGILMEPSFNEATIMTSDSCLDSSIEITKNRGTAHYLYNAISCDLTEDHIDIYVFFSPDAQWQGSKFRGELQKGDGWIRYRIPLPRTDRKVSLGFVKVTDYRNRGTTVQRVAYDGVTANQHFRLNVGLSATMMQYKELPRDINVSEIGLTAKAVATYTLVHDRFDVSVNAYGTVLTLSHSPSTLNPARYLGINARFGWQLPGKTLGGRWQVLTGWYFWNMLVAEDEYGIRSLAGPQLYLLYRTTNRRSRNLYAYLKFAPIVDTMENLSLDNNESAFGLGYQLSPPSTKQPIFLTLDVAKARFQAFQLVNSMELLSVSLGASINL